MSRVKKISRSTLFTRTIGSLALPQITESTETMLTTWQLQRMCGKPIVAYLKALPNIYLYPNVQTRTHKAVMEAKIQSGYC
jgi:hypothetical protein